MKTIGIYGVATLLLVLVVATFVQSGTVSSQSQTAPVANPSVVRLVTGTVPIAVAGVVEAARSTVVYAQTSGVITTLPYQEGAEVGRGAVLATQETPVAAAQQRLANAQGQLTDIESAVLVTERATAATATALRAYSAAEVAALRTRMSDTNVAAAHDTVKAEVAESEAPILAALDYLNTQRSLLTTAGVAQLNTAVRLVYGNRLTEFDAGYLTGSAMTPAATLTALRASAASSPVAAVAAADATSEVLTALAAALASAEKDVFDRTGGVDAAGTDAYLAQRTAVTTQLAQVEASTRALERVLNAVLEDAAVQNTTVAVTALDQATAATQAELAQERAARAVLVAAAAKEVVTAEQSLGTVRAPFAGVVSRVLADVGSYAQPGTPLLELVGDGAREVTVTIPRALATLVTPGQSVVVGETVIGVVDRVAPMSVGHGVTVVIMVTSEDTSVGSTVRGQLLLPPADAVYEIPRSHLHFTSAGPSIVYGEDDRVPVTIVYDAGDTMFIRVARVSERPLRPAY
jgi:multidrug resistance efflux pump